MESSFSKLPDESLRRQQAETDLEQARAEARAQADSLKAILDAVPAITFVADDPSCRRMVSSRAAYELLRLPVGANSSKSAPEGECPTFTVLEHGKEVLAEELPVQKAASTGQEIRNRELKIVFEDNTSIDIFGHAVPIFDEHGKVRGAVGAFVDITERKRAEEDLIASETRYRELAGNLDREVQLRTRELRERTDEVMSMYEGMRLLSSRLLQAQDEERRRIARDLHDSAGQLLTALGIELAIMTADIEKSVPHLTKCLQSSTRLVQEVHREIRTTSYLLHPPLLDEAGLCSALKCYVEGLNERALVDIHLEIPDDIGRLPHDLELVLFRLVQECLTNVHRHSGGKTATIKIARDETAITVTIGDDGKGIPPDRLAAVHTGASGVGIRGMRERLHQFQGELFIESGDHGTRVLARIPIPAQTGADENGIEPLPAAV